MPCLCKYLVGYQDIFQAICRVFQDSLLQGAVGSHGGSLPAAEEAALTRGALTEHLTQGIQPDFAMRSSRWQCRQTNRSQCQFENTELRMSKV